MKKSEPLILGFNKEGFELAGKRLGPQMACFFGVVLIILGIILLLIPFIGIPIIAGGMFLFWIGKRTLKKIG